jgi:hypothetical protein
MSNASNNPKVRKFTSFIGAIALCAGAFAAVTPAFMDPGPQAAIGSALSIAATEAGREAYLASMRAQGYELLPPVQIQNGEIPVAPLQ